MSILTQRQLNQNNVIDLLASKSHALQLPKRGRGRPTPKAAAAYEKKLRAWCDGIKKIASSSELDFAVSSRGWCYVLEEYDLFKDDFDTAQTLINDCRKSGHLPLDICCEDERRSAEHLEDIDDVDPLREAKQTVDYVNRAEQSYFPFSFWNAQDTYLEMVVEKVDLRSLFSLVCEPFHIALTNGGGWSDLHSRAAMMGRFAWWESRGKEIVLLYCGDHDPGGLHISNFIKKNLQDMAGCVGWSPDNLKVDRFGLNKDFIKRHNLTWINNLRTAKGEFPLNDVRHRDHYKDYVQNYIKEHGVRKVEATALVKHPQAARALCRQAILKYLNADAPEEFELSLELPRRKMRKEIRRLLRHGVPIMNSRRRLIDRHRRNVIQFPARGPFAVWVRPDPDGWLVVCRSHGWLHGDKHNAIVDAKFVAATHGVAVRVAS